MKCLHCTKLNLRENVPMSLLGFGKCAEDKQKAHSVSFRFERQCADFEHVSDAVKIKREIWAKQQSVTKV